MINEYDWDNDLLLFCGREVIRRNRLRDPASWVTPSEEWDIGDMNFHGITDDVMAVLDAYVSYHKHETRMRLRNAQREAAAKLIPNENFDSTRTVSENA